MSRAAPLVRTGAWLLVLATLATAGTACAMQQPESPAAVRRELRALLAAGRLQQAEAVARRRAGELELATALGEVLAEQGRLDEAGAAFARAVKDRAPDRMLAQARLAELEERRGRREESRRLARDLAARAEAGDRLTAEDWTAAGIAYRLLGAEDPQLFKEALRAFDRAIAADSTALEAQLRVGDLFLEKYNAPDARAAYQELLRRDPGNARARLGLARVRLFEGDAGAWADARLSLAANPNLVSAHALLARMALDAEEYDSARAHAARAAALDSSALEAWALTGAVAALTGDSAGFREAERRAGRLTPRPADFYAEIAEAAARHRRYAEAVALACRAVALDSGSARALGTLGVNQLRTGAIDSGRAYLERAFAKDPYHVWNKNTLDLLDTFASYRTTASARFVIVADPEESELLSLYLAPLLEQAFDTLARRYGYHPPTPVRLELFRRHADFSVRTVGLTGLGALGVSFGSLLAMDSPSARDPGDFNWGSTAWHELTHAFTLGLSRDTRDLSNADLALSADGRRLEILDGTAVPQPRPQGVVDTRTFKVTPAPAPATTPSASERSDGGTDWLPIVAIALVLTATVGLTLRHRRRPAST